MTNNVPEKRLTSGYIPDDASTLAKKESIYRLYVPAGTNLEIIRPRQIITKTTAIVMTVQHICVLLTSLGLVTLPLKVMATKHPT